MVKVLQLFNKLKSFPMGKQMFSLSFAVWAPYFMTIRPYVEELEAGRTVVSMNQRWGVQNHIKTVHAIAVCNLVEMAMGLVAEATIPSHLRWIPMGMDVRYKAKAMGKLTALSDIDPETFFSLEKYPGMVKVPVEVKDKAGVVVSDAEVRLWISEKPQKK